MFSNRTRRRRYKSQLATQAKRREQTYFLNTKINSKIYTQTIIHVKDKASNQNIEGTIRCIDGSIHGECWQINLKQIRADLFMSNDKMKEIQSRDGSPNKPFYELFIGKVYFTDIASPRHEKNPKNKL